MSSVTPFQSIQINKSSETIPKSNWVSSLLLDAGSLWGGGREERRRMRREKTCNYHIIAWQMSMEHFVESHLDIAWVFPSSSCLFPYLSYSFSGPWSLWDGNCSMWRVLPSTQWIPKLLLPYIWLITRYHRVDASLSTLHPQQPHTMADLHHLSGWTAATPTNVPSH